MIYSLLHKLGKGRRSPRPNNHAVERVLDTYELLEAILLQLPLPNLRHARQVSKIWLAVIERSHHLQDIWKLHSGKYVRKFDLYISGQAGTGKSALIEEVSLSLSVGDILN